jgi:prophage tail gpP-like protein
MTDQIQRVEITGHRIDDTVKLVINSKAWAGWTDVRVTRGLERMPSDFELHVTELSPADGQRLIINAGDACEVRIGSDTVITGYVDRVAPSITAHQHTVTIAGRGKCADLVDCSAEAPSGQFKNSTILEIAQTLCKPYGIQVFASGDPGKHLPQFNIDLTESAWSVIERMARFLRLVAYERTDGNLQISQVTSSSFATAPSGFKEGVNVEQAAALFANDQRYSEYQVVRTGIEILRDSANYENVITTVRDGGVSRHRRHVVVAEASGDGIDDITGQGRAEWEAARRIGRSAMLRLTTDSWRAADGTLYQPGQLARFQLPSLYLADVQWAISEVTYRAGPDGTHCDITAMPLVAFLQQPTLAPFNVLPRDFYSIPLSGAQ